MHEAILPTFDRAPLNPRPGVYVDLAELVGLQFQAHGFTLLPRQPRGSTLAGRHASRLRGRGLDFEELRRYLPGDDVRALDWKVTARTRKPHVRVYTEERDRPALLLVDQRASMFFGTRHALKSVAAARAAALAAWRLLAQGDRVGALVFDDRELIEIAPRRSARQVTRILEAIVRLNRRLGAHEPAAPNPGMYNAALRRALGTLRHDGLVATVGDGSGIDAESRALGTRIAAHNDAIVLFVHDPLEATLPDAGALVFGRGALQLEIDSASAPLRERYHARFAERLAGMQAFCAQRRVPLIPLSTHTGVAEQLRTLLGSPAHGR